MSYLHQQRRQFQFLSPQTLENLSISSDPSSSNSTNSGSEQVEEGEPSDEHIGNVNNNGKRWKFSNKRMSKSNSQELTLPITFLKSPPTPNTPNSTPIFSPPIHSNLNPTKRLKPLLHPTTITPSQPILMTSNKLRKPRKAVRFEGKGGQELSIEKVELFEPEDQVLRKSEKVKVKVCLTYSGEVYDRSPIEPTDPSTSLCLPKRESEKCCWIKCLERGMSKSKDKDPSKTPKKSFKLAVEKMEGKSIGRVKRVEKRATSPMEILGGGASASSEEDLVMIGGSSSSSLETSQSGSLVGSPEGIKNFELGEGLGERLKELEEKGFLMRSIESEEEEEEEGEVELDMDGITDADVEVDENDNENEMNHREEEESNTEEETETFSFYSDLISQPTSFSSISSLSLGTPSPKKKGFNLLKDDDHHDETPKFTRHFSLSPSSSMILTPTVFDSPKPKQPCSSLNASVESLEERVSTNSPVPVKRSSSFGDEKKEKEKIKARFGMCGMGKWTRDEVYKSCDAFGGF